MLRSPSLVQAGAVLVGLGGAADLLAHATSAVDAGPAHLLTLVGMLVALLGLVLRGLRTTP
jgi:hypothetical protein